MEETHTSPKESYPQSPLEMKMPEEGFTQTSRTSLGLVLGILIVLLVLILGGLYLWGSIIRNQEIPTEMVPALPNLEPETPRAEVDRTIIETTSPSDSLESIESDIEGTILDDLDSELNTLEQELNTELGV